MTATERYIVSVQVDMSVLGLGCVKTRGRSIAIEEVICPRLL